MATMSELGAADGSAHRRRGTSSIRRAVGAAPPSTTFKSEAWALFLGFAELLRDADPTLSYASSVRARVPAAPGPASRLLDGVAPGRTPSVDSRRAAWELEPKSAPLASGRAFPGRGSHLGEERHPAQVHASNADPVPSPGGTSPQVGKIARRRRQREPRRPHRPPSRPRPSSRGGCRTSASRRSSCWSWTSRPATSSTRCLCGLVRHPARGGPPPKLSLDAYEAALPDVLKKRARATIEETMEFLELNRKTVIKYRRELRARRTIVTKTFPTPVSDDPEPDVIARLARVVLAKLGPAARHLSRERTGAEDPRRHPCPRR